jgi:hypothetical protein
VPAASDVAIPGHVDRREQVLTLAGEAGADPAQAWGSFMLSSFATYDQTEDKKGAG